MTARFALIAIWFLMAIPMAARQPPRADELIERMKAYLVEYETQLSSVVADERFQQRIVFTRAYKNGQPVTSDERRRLDSEVGFIRLPGGADWLGFRHVRKINGRDVRGGDQGMSALLSSTADLIAQARAIASASGEHNLGVPRSTNVPTAALEIIHPRNLDAHRFRVAGNDTIRGTRVAVLGFTETRRPPLVSGIGGQQLVSHGRVWLEPQGGRIWRVEWIYAPDIGPQSSLRVDFAMNDALGIMVPLEMREEFPSMGGLNARGDGVAYYSNFRRFTTGGRIVQEPFDLAQGAP